MPVSINRLKKSRKYIAAFYMPVFLAALAYLSVHYDANLLAAVLIVLCGNLFLAIATQVSNYIIEKRALEGVKSRDFVYLNFTDCFFRSGAGFLEIILYTICFSLGLETIVGGYLLLKTVSIWQDKDNFNNKKEGLHTAMLRLAIVVSLLISLMAAYYLKKYLNT